MKSVVRALLFPESSALPAGVRRLLPGTSRRAGPPRRAAWIAEYVQRHQAAWTEVVPGGVIPALDHMPAEPSPVAYLDVAAAHPPAGVLEVRDARVFGRHGWAVAPEDECLLDANHWFGQPDETPIFRWRRWSQPRRLHGRVVNLLSFSAYGNYYHFLLEVLPKLFLLEAAAIRWRECDHILFPETSIKSSLEVAARLDLPRDRLRFPAADEQIEAELLIQPSQPGAPRMPPRWAADYVRQRFGRPAGREPGARWSILRTHDRRGAANTEAIGLVLAQRGFRAFRHVEHTDEAGTMAAAEAVVGEHGAGLARIVFCRPGTPVVELLPRDRPYPYYRALCEACSLRHAVVLSEPQRAEGRPVYDTRKVADALAALRL